MRIFIQELLNRGYVLFLVNIQSMNQNEIKVQSFVGLIHKHREWLKTSMGASNTYEINFWKVNLAFKVLYNLSFTKFLILISIVPKPLHTISSDPLWLFAIFDLVHRTLFLIHIYKEIALIFQSPDKISYVLWILPKFLLKLSPFLSHYHFCSYL